MKVLLLLVFFFSFYGYGASESFNILKNIEKDIYKNPWQSYQRIISLRPLLLQQPIATQLLWHQEKATAENLLFFQKDFVNSVAEARKLLTANSDITVKTKLIYYAGMIAQRQHEYQKSIQLLSRALDLAQGVNNHVLSIQIKQERAYTRSLIELFDVSFDDLQSAYIDAFALDDEFLIAIINETYGAIHRYLGNYDQSIEYYQKALETYEQFGYLAHFSETLYGLALTYREAKNYPLAIEYYKHYEKSIGYTPNLDVNYFSAYGLGMTLAEKGDCQQAIKVIDKALTLYGTQNDNAELYKKKAFCLIELGEFSDAELSLIKAKAIFNSIPELAGTKWQLETIKLAGLLAYAKEDYLSAFELTSEYYEKYSKNLVDNASDRISQVRKTQREVRKGVELDLLEERMTSNVLADDNAKKSSQAQLYLILLVSIIIICVVLIVYIQRINHQKVKNLSIKDELTNVYNRRYIFDYWHRLMTKHQDKTTMAILVIDIDDFKILNDLYGRPIGDMILKQVANIAKNSLRSHDIIARIGDEEFLCLLPRADESLALNVANRLLTSINLTKFVIHGNESLQISVSAGIRCINNQKNIDVDKLYAQADKALYRAKMRGKNQVVIYQERS